MVVNGWSSSAFRSFLFDVLPWLDGHDKIPILQNERKMSKISGLHLVKPRFDWEIHDKLTEIKQFKANCKILFDGPLSDLKDMQRQV